MSNIEITRLSNIIFALVGLYLCKRLIIEIPKYIEIGISFGLWLVHVVVFNLSVVFCDIPPSNLNIWSNIIRLQAMASMIYSLWQLLRK